MPNLGDRRRKSSARLAARLPRGVAHLQPERSCRVKPPVNSGNPIIRSSELPCMQQSHLRWAKFRPAIDCAPILPVMYFRTDALLAAKARQVERYDFDWLSVFGSFGRSQI